MIVEHRNKRKKKKKSVPSSLCKGEDDVQMKYRKQRERKKNQKETSLLNIHYFVDDGFHTGVRIFTRQ